ncbi:MAG: hypothetical protein D6761_13680 [Candidatus Dadabacteria bacterium]|nr:MAG: hypothetical protein D6761_13680 [Candidatus Dadabacteria bacterium]
MTSEYTRKSPRVSLKLRVHCAGDGLYFSDVTRDISEGGVGIDTLSRLRPGEELQMEMITPDGDKITVRTKVVWVKPADDPERVSAGLEFRNVDDTRRQTIRRVLETHGQPLRPLRQEP